MDVTLFTKLRKLRIRMTSNEELYGVNPGIGGEPLPLPLSPRSRDCEPKAIATPGDRKWPRKPRADVERIVKTNLFTPPLEVALTGTSLFPLEDAWSLM